jgi:phosphoribosyl-AMP cyclohydrolase
MFIVETNPNKSFNTQSIEETNILNLDFMKLSTFSDHNVIPVAVQNAITQEVILVAYTNEIAFKETVKQKKAIFWSTSRNELWLKGQDSGNTFTIRSIFVNVPILLTPQDFNNVMGRFYFTKREYTKCKVGVL